MSLVQENNPEQLSTLEQQMRERVPAEIVNQVTEVDRLFEVTKEILAESDARQSAWYDGSTSGIGVIAEGIIDTGIVRRNEAQKLGSLMPGTDNHANVLDTIVKRCVRENTRPFSDKRSIIEQLDWSLERLTEIYSEDEVITRKSVNDVQEHSLLLLSLLSVEAYVFTKQIPEDSIVLEEGETVAAGRASLAREICSSVAEPSAEGLSTKGQDRLSLATDTETWMIEINSIIDLGKKINEYGATVSALAREYNAKIESWFDENEVNLRTAADEIRRSVGLLPAILEDYVNNDRSDIDVQQRIIGALCVENWMEVIYEKHGVRAAREESKPLHVVLEQAEHEQQLAELESTLEPMQKEVAEIEGRYDISAKALRELEGTSLKRMLEEYREPGSNRTMLASNQAHQLAGLALSVEDKPTAQKFRKDRQKFRKDVHNLHQLWIDIAYLSPQTKRDGLICILNVLMEWHESATDRLLNERRLAPVWELAKLLKEPIADEQQTSQSNNGTASPEPSRVDGGSLWRIPGEFAHLEFIEPFPPGERNDIVNDLTAVSRGWHGEVVEWERIYSLIELRQELQAKGLAVATHRLRQTGWHALPHYVLEVVNPTTGSVAAIVESPIYGNASYVIPDKDWREVVRFSKEEVRRDWGGIAKVHSANRPASEHRDKLKSAVIANI